MSRRAHGWTSGRPKSRFSTVRRGVAGYRGGADEMAWEATTGNWRRRRADALGFGGLMLVLRKL